LLVVLASTCASERRKPDLPEVEPGVQRVPGEGNPTAAARRWSDWRDPKRFWSIGRV